MNNPQERQTINETEGLGSWTKEMIKPENLDPRVFHTAEEVMQATWNNEE